MGKSTSERESYEIAEKKRNYLSAVPMCPVCHIAPTYQLAHRISQGKRSQKLYSKHFIHHPYNIVPVCSLACNAKVVIDHNPEAKSVLTAAIALDLEGNEEKARETLKMYDFVASEVLGML